MTATFTIDGYDPHHEWPAVRYGPRWNGWATLVVTRGTLTALIAASCNDEDGPTLHFVDHTVAVIDGGLIHPDVHGHYDLGHLGWCFIETDYWAAADQ